MARPAGVWPTPSLRPPTPPYWPVCRCADGEPDVLRRDLGVRVYADQPAGACLGESDVERDRDDPARGCAAGGRAGRGRRTPRRSRACGRWSHRRRRAPRGWSSPGPGSSRGRPRWPAPRCGPARRPRRAPRWPSLLGWPSGAASRGRSALRPRRPIPGRLQTCVRSSPCGAGRAPPDHGSGAGPACDQAGAQLDPMGPIRLVPTDEPGGPSGRSAARALAADRGGTP